MTSASETMDHDLDILRPGSIDMIEPVFVKARAANPGVSALDIEQMRMRTFHRYAISVAMLASALMLAMPPARGQTAADMTIRTACRGDYTKFCMGTMPGGGRIAACLNRNERYLSPSCKNAVAKAKSQKSDR